MLRLPQYGGHKPQPKYSISGEPQCWCITVHFRDADKCKARLTVLASSPPIVCQHLLFQPRNRNKIMTVMAQMTALWGNRSMTTTGTTTSLSRWKHPAVLQASIKTGSCMAWTIPTSSFQDSVPNRVIVLVSVSQLVRTNTSSTHHKGHTLPSYTKFAYYYHHSHRARLLTIKYTNRRTKHTLH
jgi:hypothetical protein